MRRVLGLAVVVLALTSGVHVGAAVPDPVEYRPPVDAPLADVFRPPADRFGRGNRGIDYATGPGTPVGAAAPGEVTFAGPVGPTRHVVVLHADGLRTSYSFLAAVTVARGDRVEAGQVVGVTGGPLHFGVRAGDVYLDPLTVLGQHLRGRVHLVPDRPGTEGERQERFSLDQLVRALPSRPVGDAALGWARGLAANALGPGAGPDVAALEPVVPPPWSLASRLAAAAESWRASQAICTPPEVRPPQPRGRRLAVLVGGLGSTSSHAAVDQLAPGPWATRREMLSASPTGAAPPRSTPTTRPTPRWTSAAPGNGCGPCSSACTPSTRACRSTWWPIPKGGWWPARRWARRRRRWWPTW